MTINPQFQLALIDRHVEKDIVEQRITDGYINATDICKACEKQISHYLETKATKDFLSELSSDTGIPISELIEINKGGIPKLQGTWVHPQIAIHLGQWASPKFAVLISKWVFEWMNGRIPGQNKFPYHLQRYLINRSEIPYTHFSVFNEIVLNLIAPLEDNGYELPDSLVPDISEGRMFASWVRKVKNLEPNDFPTYTHIYPDGRRIPNVKLYPNSLLADFRKHFYEVWIRERAMDYFKDKDKNALPYLEKVIKALPEPVKELSDFDTELKGLLSVSHPKKDK
jgi:hypothetical protein